MYGGWFELDVFVWFFMFFGSVDEVEDVVVFGVGYFLCVFVLLCVFEFFGRKMIE